MATASVPRRVLGAAHSQLIAADSFSPDWDEDRAREICGRLELGHIVLFSQSPLDIPVTERELLLGHKQSSSPYHKNIAYRASEDRVTGLDASRQAEAAALRRILRGYSQNVVAFLSLFLLPYAGKWKLDCASFRPFEEQGRPARLHARNDLLHIDSFPTRPTNGARILRFFTNINPARNRVWLTSQTFESFATHFASQTRVSRVFRTPFAGGLRALARALRLPGGRPPYDELMHRTHNAMKEDAGFQETTPKHRWEFPPNSSWMLFTDCVSHAVLSGQYALEQTLLIPHFALVEPGHSPLAILESIVGAPLTV